MIYLAVKRRMPRGYVGQTVENTASLESLHIFINEKEAREWVEQYSPQCHYIMIFDTDGIAGPMPVKHHGSLIHK